MRGKEWWIFVSEVEEVGKMFFDVVYRGVLHVPQQYSLYLLPNFWTVLCRAGACVYRHGHLQAVSFCGFYLSVASREGAPVDFEPEV